MFLGARTAALAAVLCFTSLVDSSQALAVEIIGSDGKEYNYRGLRPRHHHHAHAHKHGKKAHKAKAHAEHMLNHGGHKHHRRARPNVTAVVPVDVPQSHLVTSSRRVPSGSEVPETFRDRMNRMHADWCAGLSRDDADFERCAGFMGKLCHPKHASAVAGMPKVTQGLCAKFFWTSGEPVNLGLDASTGYAPGPAAPNMEYGLSPAPMGETAIFSPAASPMMLSPAPAPGPAFELSEEPAELRAARGVINDGKENVLMPEQGFAGRLVAHDDTHTQLADWHLEYGPGMTTYEEICGKYPHNPWCRAKGYHFRERSTWQSSAAHGTARAGGAADAHGGHSSETNSRGTRWHEAFRDVFRAREDSRSSAEREADAEKAVAEDADGHHVGTLDSEGTSGGIDDEDAASGEMDGGAGGEAEAVAGAEERAVSEAGARRQARAHAAHEEGMPPHVQPSEQPQEARERIPAYGGPEPEVKHPGSWWPWNWLTSALGFS